MSAQANANDLPRLAAPARRALASANITRLDQLPRYAEADLLKLHGMGPKALRILREALAECGLALADEQQTGS